MMHSVTQNQDELFPQPDAEAACVIQPAFKGTPLAELDELMPYEAVAKAIFVKANGLPAYRKATRIIRHAG
jgi:hypothetical protein